MGPARQDSVYPSLFDLGRRRPGGTGCRVGDWSLARCGGHLDRTDGLFVLMVWSCRRGTIGPNCYGPDPLGDVPGATSSSLHGQRLDLSQRGDRSRRDNA